MAGLRSALRYQSIKLGWLNQHPPANPNRPKATFPDQFSKGPVAQICQLGCRFESDC